MPYWVCYHNADEHGRLPGDHEHRIDLVEFAADGRTHGAELCGIYTKKGSVYDAVGDTVFLITGIGRSPKKYFLWEWFVIDEIRDRRDDEIEAYGQHGAVLDPAPRLFGHDFDEFRRANGNFGLGFQNITDYPYLDRLLVLSGIRDAS